MKTLITVPEENSPRFNDYCATELFDYYHIGEGVFCTECRNPDTNLKEQVQPNKEYL
ncbi:hypothetical protein [Bacteroides fragilis]|uniref:Uncharacterized protein n=1 Tax=Bacteroides fragilis (strain YCH46) TaxID=295405 RepID=Q64MB9_BACFR|nr:hypothetical protein [Bacteroides fragilis]BAD51368.1 hypothetical protein BFp0041 [Bacteroides fragilis YCH46]